MKDDTIVVKIRFYDHELGREQVIYGEVEAIKVDQFETNEDSWITLTDPYRSLVVPKVDVINISDLKKGEDKYRKHGENETKSANARNFATI